MAVPSTWRAARPIVWMSERFLLDAGVQPWGQLPLWVPEVNGPIDPANEAHDMIMSTFGSISKGERSRIKTRVRATMAATPS